MADIPNAVIEKSNWDSAYTHNVVILVYHLKQDLLQISVLAVQCS